MFKNREDAGQQLAQRLKKYKDQPYTLVVGLARGGVVVAAEIAKALKIPLNVVVPRKVGAPHNPELGLGAVTGTGEAYLNESLIRELGVSKAYLKQEIERERAKAEERQTLYAQYAPKPNFHHQAVILVDDGIATGGTMLAAVQAVQKQKPARLIVATPVCAPSIMKALQKLVDEVVCVEMMDLGSVSMSYESFPQVEDKEVIALL